MPAIKLTSVARLADMEPLTCDEWGRGNRMTDWRELRADTQPRLTRESGESLHQEHAEKRV
ncbi:hypothetical protein GCM10009555_016080 [Acrocarpospora macrocephala]|uniref:Uncharacterized protein n=1 Tax=Acrocarpospora macrocephala TaxID=150177 RepID=A0A5M3X590_9ACTN|nr:hypothetical protein Amac_093900 [Acrocarpospora macrocephala]